MMRIDLQISKKNIEDLKTRFQEIRNLVKNNELERCFKRVMDFVNDFGNDDVINEALVKNMEYVEIKNNLRKEPMSQEFLKEKSKLALATLSLVTELNKRYIEVYEESNNEY